MKTLSLKLNEGVYNETERILLRLKKPRNRYINEAIDFYNKIQERKLLSKRLNKESALVSSVSMSVLKDLELLDDGL